MTRNGMPHTDEVGEPRVDSGDRDPIATARTFFLSGDGERAKRLADEVISNEPLRQDAWILKGRTLVCRYDPVGAKECYKQAIEIDAGNPETWKRMAFAHRIDGELEDAVDCWRKALDLGPEDHRTLNDIGSALDELGEFDTAIEYYEKALEVNPDDPFARENIRLNRRIIERLTAQRND